MALDLSLAGPKCLRWALCFGKQPCSCSQPAGDADPREARAGQQTTQPPLKQPPGSVLRAPGGGWEGRVLVPLPFLGQTPTREPQALLLLRVTLLGGGSFIPAASLSALASIGDLGPNPWGIPEPMGPAAPLPVDLSHGECTWPQSPCPQEKAACGAPGPAVRHCQGNARSLLVH